MTKNEGAVLTKRSSRATKDGANADRRANGTAEDDRQELSAVFAQIRELVRDGATTRPTTAQKFALGDLIIRFQEIQKRADERAAQPGASPADLSLQKEYRQRDAAFFTNQAVSRTTIIDWARVAKAFPPGHKIRTRLAFAYAKTLTSLESAAERDYWFEQAELRKISVRQLQAEISSRRGPGSAVPRGRKQSKAFLCAQTGRAITDLSLMVTVQFPGTAKRSSPTPASDQAAARPALQDSTSAETADATALRAKTLRFQDMKALAAWTAAHQQEFLNVPEPPKAQISSKTL